MPIVKWRPQARQELKDILKFIARQDNRPATAARIRTEIREKINLVSQNPEMGSAKDELPDDCRMFLHKRWAIIYEPKSYGIEIVRVIDTARDFGNMF